MATSEADELAAMSDRQTREERVAVDLARLGWLTPIWVRPDEAVQLLGGGDPDAVDRAFVELLGTEGTKGYERLATELSSCIAARPWPDLIRQMDSAYRRNEYAIIIPAALVVLEGILARQNDSELSVQSIVRSRVPEPPMGYRLHRVMWLATHEFVQALYSRHEFDGPEPPSMNRHWILHGRSPADWSRADALRLMLACYVTTYLTHNPG